MMFKFSNFAALALLAAIAANTVYAAGTVAAQDNDSVVSVDNVVIPQMRFVIVLNTYLQKGAQDSDKLQDQVKQEVIDLEVITQAATKKNLHKQAEVAELLEITKQSILQKALFNDYAKNIEVTEDQLKQKYESEKNIHGREFRVAHILVKTEKEAQDILASLKQKGNFEKIAKDKSLDPGSKSDGGLIGWVSTASGLAPEFTNALLKMKKDQLSEPVKTQFGWHIIRVNDIRDVAKFPSFEQVNRQYLKNLLANEGFPNYVKSLRANSIIKP
jgi:peptidyl-prolyl cis-trans isomerase C